MRQVLTLHPDCRRAPSLRVEVDVSRPQLGSLLLQYLVIGKMSELRLPMKGISTRTDQLWQHSCFEAFFRVPPAAMYYEFNFAPSTQWAAYRFASYREGMAVAAEIDTPHLSAISEGDRFRLQVTLDMTHLPNSPVNKSWRLGLSAIIEDSSGEKSYWGLAHPPGKPDFHHPDCFVYELPATGRA